MPRALSILVLLALAVGCARAKTPPTASSLRVSPLDVWSDAQELDFGLLVAFEVLSRHGSTRYLPSGDSADGDPRRIIHDAARQAATRRPLETYLSRVLQRVAAQGARHEKALNHRGRERSFTVFVIEADEVYCVAAPGRLVLITTGMLSVLANEAELAFILGSEVAHIDREHALDVARLKLHSSGSRVADPIADLETAENMVQAVMTALFETGLGRVRDFEADRLALLYMTGADYDSTGPITALNKLAKVEQEDRGRVWVATHPRAKDRIQALADPLEQLQQPYLDGDIGAKAFRKSVLESPELSAETGYDEPPDFDAPEDGEELEYREAE